MHASALARAVADAGFFDDFCFGRGVRERTLLQVLHGVLLGREGKSWPHRQPETLFLVKF
jgi:hypothetical protein